MTETKNNTAKGFAIILAIVIALLGAYASNSVQLQSNQIDILKERIVELTVRFEKYCDKADDTNLRRSEKHAELVSEVNAIKEKFKEVETQFKSQKDISILQFNLLKTYCDDNIKWREDHGQMVIGLNSAQWERIKTLERCVYGKSIPVTIGEAVGADNYD